MPDPADLPPPGDPRRFSVLAHHGRRVLGPIAEDRLDAIVARLRLPSDAAIVELAPGKGELLVRILAANPGAHAVGVDRSPWFLAEARSRAAELGVAERLALHDADAAAHPWPEGTADLAVSMGAAGILGDHAGTLASLAAMVRPGGGLVLFGDGVWTAEPPEEGLLAFGMERDELPDGLAGQRALGEAAGLQPEWSELVSEGEWDDYETAYGAAVPAWLAANPADADQAAFLGRLAEMRDSYAGWRRGAFGFGISLFRR